MFLCLLTGGQKVQWCIVGNFCCVWCVVETPCRPLIQAVKAGVVLEDSRGDGVTGKEEDSRGFRTACSVPFDCTVLDWHPEKWEHAFEPCCRSGGKGAVVVKVVPWHEQLSIFSVIWWFWMASYSVTEGCMGSYVFHLRECLLNYCCMGPGGGSTWRALFVRKTMGNLKCVGVDSYNLILTFCCCWQVALSHASPPLCLLSFRRELRLNAGLQELTCLLSPLIRRLCLSGGAIFTRGRNTRLLKNRRKALLPFFSSFYSYM